MRVDEEIRKKLLENFEKWKEELNREIDYYLDLIKDAERVEHLMHLKKRFLLSFLKYLPIHREYCYFCIMKVLRKLDTCMNCPYAKYHQECLQKYSDYAIIMRHLNMLYELINKLYYYTGEEEYEAVKHTFEQKVCER